MIDWLVSLAAVFVIDIALSGDNAIVIGMAAAGLPPDLRRKAIVYGIAAAALLRIAFAAVTLHLLAIIGLTLAGGLLLLWVCWKLWREIQEQHFAPRPANGDGYAASRLTDQNEKTFGSALMAIIVADVSMALDNVLAVAGAARDHLAVLVIGLGLSIVLMACASNYIAKLLERRPWLAFIGLAVVGVVALDMIWRGANEVAAAFPDVG